MKSTLTLIASLALLTATTAHAREGLYVKVDLGRSDVSELNLDDSSETFGLDMGWRFTEHYGAELGFRDLGDYSGRAPVASELDAEIFTVALSGRYEFNEDSDQGAFIEGRFGLGNYDVSGREQYTTTQARNFKASGTRPFFGVGAGYNLTQNFSLAFNYSRYQAQQNLALSVGGVTRNLDIVFPTLALSAEYRF
jgi:OmpA-OmpF porin, OOP family